LIRDWSDSALAEGRTLADNFACTAIRYERGDAFSLEDLARVAPGVNIAIVSGLYELFGDNSMVRRSLSGIAGFVRPGGFLIYTNQPWHPQLEQIAETLINRDKQPWVMRRRTQAEMDELVREAGFDKLSTRIDDSGIFTVSLAVRCDR
jgi:hypothetical protein